MGRLLPPCLDRRGWLRDGGVGFGMAEGCKRFFIRSEFLYCLSAFLPLIGYQHFFFPKQNMNSSSGAMSRSPKSPSLFGLAEELAKKKCFFILQLHLFFFINFSFFFFSSSSSFLHHLLFFINFSFARAGKKSCKRKRLFHVRR